MPFPTPDLPDLRTQAWQAMQTRIDGLSPLLRRMVARPISDTNAGMVWLQWRYLVNVTTQFFADTCEGAYLDRLLSIFALPPRASAGGAAGNAVFTGQSGVAVPAATILVAPDNVTQFATQAAVTLASGTATVAIVAVSGSAGAGGNLPGGTPMALGVAIAGVNAYAALDSNGTSSGIDLESDDSVRARVLARIQNPPQGGSAPDYWSWARGVAGVTRAWVYPLNRGPGTVDVLFAMDGRASIIPLSGDVAAVQAVITADAPVTATSALAWAPVPAYTLVTIHNLVPTSARAAVIAELNDLFLTQSIPGGAGWGDHGGTQPGPITNAGTLYLGQIESAIQTAAGVASFDLVTPSADVVVANGTLAVLGTVTFT